jgi:5-hydroxyisourate hydrolase
VAGPEVSVHVLDLTRGTPAQGLEVVLSRIDGDTRNRVAAAVTDSRGRIDSFTKGPLAQASYDVSVDVRSYWATHNDSPALFEGVCVRFAVHDDRRVHLPILITANSLAAYRGH